MENENSEYLESKGELCMSVWCCNAETELRRAAGEIIGGNKDRDGT